MTHSLLTLGSILFVYMNLWFIVSLIKKRNDVADIAWGLGFVLLVWSSLFLTGNTGLRSILVTVLVSIWGLRLATHIYTRNKHKTEDPRYEQWRKDWGKWVYFRSYFQVYILQGILLFVIATPATLSILTPRADIGFLDIVGILVWCLGFFFEVVGDKQLARFIKNPNNKGKLMTEGLWQYTRHPNYFGEVTQWWGIWLIATSAQTGWISIIGPLTITFLILNVSGIPLLEKKMQQHPDFAEYKRRVSVFFPLPPKK